MTETEGIRDGICDNCGHVGTKTDPVVRSTDPETPSKMLCAFPHRCLTRYRKRHDLS